MRATFWAEIRTMLWLQWRLTVAIFRSRRGQHRMRALNLIVRALQFVFLIPLFIGMGVGLAVMLSLSSPEAAAGIAVLVSLALTFLWLIGPVMEESRAIERFEVLRLVSYPVSFGALVVGSTLASILSLPGLVSIPLLAGLIVGLAWQTPLALPAVVFGAGLAYVTWLLVGRLLEDLVDIVGANRRVRGVLIGVLTAPLVLLWMAHMAVSLSGGALIQDWIRSLGPINTGSEFVEALDVRRWAGWLPPAWPSMLMASATRGAWGWAAVYAALSAGLVAGLGRVHAILMRRLSTGAALGRERTTAYRTGWRLDWPGPTALWGLVRKDALYLWRSPLTRRTIIFTPLFTLFMSVLFLAPFSSRPFPTTPEVREWLPVVMGAGWPLFLSMIVNVQLLGNYFGAVDREGFGAIAYSGVDRRLVLASASLVGTILALALYLVPILASVAFTGLWLTLPLGVAAGLMVQAGGSPAYLLASIMGPYRAQWKMGGQNQSGGLWSLLAWLLTLPLAVVFVVLPYALYRPALWATLPLGLALSGAAFWFALRPLARLMLRREQQILTTVFKED
jgi:hypothetical protein